MMTSDRERGDKRQVVQAAVMTDPEKTVEPHAAMTISRARTVSQLQGGMPVRRLRSVGCRWLVLLPLLAFALWLYLCIQHNPMPVAHAVYQEGLALQSSVLVQSNEGPSDLSTLRSDGSLSLQDFERQVTDNYLRVQLALAVSAGSLITPGGPPFADVGTLRDLRTFQPLLTAAEKARLLYAFHLFSAACVAHGLTFFLLESSLVGSLRHHGVIPWSDVSVKVAMRVEDQPRVIEVLGGTGDMTLVWSNPYSWSLRLPDSIPDPPRVSRNIYLAIHFYHNNHTHLWAPTWGDKRIFTAEKQRVFPLAYRPFEGRLVPVPCDVSSVLGPGAVRQCRAVLEDEEDMEFRDAGMLPCRVLSRVFPFVARRVPMTSRSTVEQVSVNTSLLYSVLVDNSCDATDGLL
ncbi:uncharacterized protein [Littorina saxatilis]